MAIAGIKALVRTLMVALACAGPARAQDADLDSIITRAMLGMKVPGLAVAIVVPGEILWMRGYGFADVDRKRLVTPQTLFHVASASKPVTAAALVQLLMTRRIPLDAPIDPYLPFRVRNPDFPDVPITFRQLLLHTSSVSDNAKFYGPLWMPGAGDPAGELADYLREYLMIGGKNYDPQANFGRNPPGAEVRYCNTCYALIGYLAERITGERFQDYTRRALFAPLGMMSTGWFLASVDTTRLAMPQRFVNERYEALGHGGYPDWPAGQLRTSVEDFAHWLAAYANYGRWKGEPVLDSALVELMSPTNLGPALTWRPRAVPTADPLFPRVVYGHGGTDAGVRASISVRPGVGGLVLLMTGQPSGTDLTRLTNIIYQRTYDILERRARSARSPRD